MTNYNERLDVILHDIIHIGYVQGFNQIAHAARFAPYNHIEPITIEEAKQALYSDLLELIPKSVDTTQYSCEDSEHSFMLGYVQANIELSRKLKEYFNL